MKLALLLLVLIVGGGLLGLYSRFGTADPCGIIPAEIREQAVREGGLALLVSALPDSALDALMASEVGPLNPGRCIALALNGIPRSPTAPAQQVAQPLPPQVAAPRQSMPIPPTTADLNAATNAAIMECKGRRLAGELRTFAASARCSNPKIIDIYQRANYRYMDLIYALTTKRIEFAQQIDHGVITETQAVAGIARFQASLLEMQRQRDSGR